MRIVVDTNVLIASLISRGFCHELLERCFINHTLITSPFILNELHEKLVTKFKFSIDTADEAVLLLGSRMQKVAPASLSEPVSRDPDDDNVLATATTGECDYIITGDKDLLILLEFEGIRIFTPRDFSNYELTAD